MVSHQDLPLWFPVFHYFLVFILKSSSEADFLSVSVKNKGNNIECSEFTFPKQLTLEINCYWPFIRVWLLKRITALQWVKKKCLQSAVFFPHFMITYLYLAHWTVCSDKGKNCNFKHAALAHPHVFMLKVDYISMVSTSKTIKWALESLENHIKLFKS